MSPTNVMSGFSIAGINPFDRNLFTEDEFLLSDMTGLPSDINEFSAASEVATTSFP